MNVAAAARADVPSPNLSGHRARDRFICLRRTATPGLRLGSVSLFQQGGIYVTPCEMAVAACVAFTGVRRCVLLRAEHRGRDHLGSVRSAGQRHAEQALAVHPAGTTCRTTCRPFQTIADDNPSPADGHPSRNSGEPGYKASADYVANLMKAAGYNVTIQDVQVHLLRLQV